MSKIITIYRFVDNKLYSLQVKETEKLYIVEKGQKVTQSTKSAFNCMTKLYKHQAHTTPKKAIRVEIDRYKSLLITLKRRVKSTEKSIKDAEKFLKEYKD
jgi:hypothetical protein